MRRKIKCDKCHKESAHEHWHVEITACKCGAWNISKLTWLLALKMKENDFDWYNFAVQIDKLGEKTAKELFLFCRVIPIKNKEE